MAAASPETPPFPVISMGLAMMAKTMNPGMMDAAQPGAHPAREVRRREALAGAAVLRQGRRRLPQFPAAGPGERSRRRTASRPTRRRSRSSTSKAFQQATPEERKDFQHFMTTTQAPVAIGEADKVICVGDRLSAVQAVLALVRNGAIGDAPLLEGGDVAAQVEVKRAAQRSGQGADERVRRLEGRHEGMLSMMPVNAGSEPGTTPAHPGHRD